MAESSYPTAEVRGRSQEDPCLKGGSQEELPHVRGQGQRPGQPGCYSTGTAEGSYSASQDRGDSREERPASEARGGSREEQPHVQGVVAVWAQEGLEEPSHIEAQEGRR